MATGQGLQCLSAVCLSGSTMAPQTPEVPGFVSNAFRLCAYPAVAQDRISVIADAERLQCLSAVCLSGSGLVRTVRHWEDSVSNAFRLCAYPAAFIQHKDTKACIDYE